MDVPPFCLDCRHQAVLRVTAFIWLPYSSLTQKHPRFVRCTEIHAEQPINHGKKAKLFSFFLFFLSIFSFLFFPLPGKAMKQVLKQRLGSKVTKEKHGMSKDRLELCLESNLMPRKYLNFLKTPFSKGTSDARGVKCIRIEEVIPISSAFQTSFNCKG